MILLKGSLFMLFSIRFAFASLHDEEVFGRSFPGLLRCAAKQIIAARKLPGAPALRRSEACPLHLRAFSLGECLTPEP